MTPREYRRCRRVMEWMLTAHATMRDRYTRRSRALTLAVMALSIIGLLLALANGNQHVSVLGLHGKLQVFLAWLTALIFFVALLDLVVDWRKRAWRHEDAAGRLAELNMLFRRAIEADDGNWAVEGVDLAVEYDRVMAALHPLPERKVMSLKALHNRKRVLFTRADAYPGAPVWWIRVGVMRDGMLGRLKADQPAHSDPEADSSR
jgi:hypothetical protein